MKKKQNKQETAEEILRKIETESAEDKKKRTMDILKGKTTVKNPKDEITFFQKYQNIASQEWYSFVRKVKNPLHQRTAMITAFLCLSTYIGYQIQKKYDKMRKVASRTKSYKQMQIEKEDAYINRYLQRNAFQAVPIRPEEQEQFDPNYKYQEETNMVMDTRDYLLEAIAKEYREGKKIDPQMENQLRSKGLIE